MAGNRKRLIPIRPYLMAFLLLLLFLAYLPGRAFAAGDTVKIESERNDAFDYLEYSSGGSWKDLNTPKHWVEGTGEVCYCVEHTESSPHGTSYRAADPDEVFSGTTLKGLTIILTNGYPCVMPDGFSEDEARQATANAVRFWLSERGESGSYSFTNRKEHPDQVRAKSGYGHVLEWADELLEMARKGKAEEQEISFDPETLVLSETGSGYGGTAQIRISGLEEYDLDTSLVPDGVTVSGYTGKRSETLTIAADSTAAGKRFSLLAVGRGTQSADNITAYIPSNGSKQKIFLCADTEQVLTSAKLWVSVPSAPLTGSLSITKVGEEQDPLSGVRFGIYTDAGCTQQIAELTTDSQGNALLEGLDPGTVYVKELETRDGYNLDTNVYPITIWEGQGTQMTLGNRKASGVIRIIKTGEDGKQLAGVSFGIYSDSACSDLVREGKTDSSGILEITAVPDGRWYVRELETVKPYVLGRETAEVLMISGTTHEVRMVNRIQKGSILVMKSGDDGEPLEGVSFGLYSDSACSSQVGSGITNENGTLTFRELTAGSYYLKELETVQPYGLDDSVHPVLVEEGKTAEVSIVNRRQTGGIRIVKTGPEGEPLQDVSFGIYSDSDCTRKAGEGKTDASGMLTVSGLNGGTYYVKELAAVAPYILSGEATKVTVSAGETAEIRIVNQLQAGSVRVIKTGDNGKELEGVLFGIFSDHACTQKVQDGRTDGNGILTFGSLDTGTYYVRELATVSPYVLNADVTAVTVKAGETAEVRLVNQLQPGSIRIVKTGEDGTALSGVSFSLYSDADCRIKAADGKTDRTGVLVFDNLSAGTYYLKETETVDAYILSSDVREISVAAGAGTEIRLVNEKEKGSLRIVKTGPDGEPVYGARFVLCSDAACTERIASAVTGADGTAEVSGLSEGTVYVRETAVPAPYVLDDAAHPAGILSGKTVTLKLRNEKACGQIRIEKTAMQPAVPERTETDYGPMFVPKLAEKGIGGAVFEIRDAEGSLKGTVTTGDTGIAVLGNLPFGTYTVRETQAPDGYVPDPEPQTVALAYLDDQAAVVEETVRLVNERIPNRVRIRKTVERYDAAKREFVRVPGEGYVFGLYTAEKIGTCPAGTLVELLTTGADGTAETEYPHAAGEYELKELSSPDSTVKTLEKPLPVSLHGNHTLYFDNPIENVQYRGIITVQKADADTGLPLAGARFEIRSENGVFIRELATGTEGTASSDPLPPGRYLLRELQPPKGYAVNGRTVWTEIQARDGSNPVVRWTDQPIQTVLSKTDLTDARPVPGAEITIRNADGSMYVKAVTDQNGEILLDRIPAGSYTFTETIAPDGYAVNQETFRFTVDENGRISGDTEITDEPTCLTLLKVKAENGEPMQGVLFTLKNRKGKTVRTMLTPEGYRIPAKDGDESFRTDINGKAEIRHLPAGTYTLTETAPAGMIPSDPVTVTLTDRNGTGNPAAVTVANASTALKLFKTDAETGEPLSGAAFRILAEDKTEKTALTFRQQDDRSWLYDPGGTVTEIPVNAEGEILFKGIPIGTVWIEESAVPEGYFPAKAEKLKITAKMTASNPGRVTVKNSRFVKLGLDTDRWVKPVLRGLFVLLGLFSIMVIMLPIAGKKCRDRMEKQQKDSTGTEQNRTNC